MQESDVRFEQSFRLKNPELCEQSRTHVWLEAFARTFPNQGSRQAHNQQHLARLIVAWRRGVLVRVLAHWDEEAIIRVEIEQMHRRIVRELPGYTQRLARALQVERLRAQLDGQEPYGTRILTIDDLDALDGTAFERVRARRSAEAPD